MKIQELIKKENWNKPYQSEGYKYKFDGKELLYYSITESKFIPNNITFNNLLKMNFMEIKRAYSFIEAMNDEDNEYYPEGYEKYILKIYSDEVPVLENYMCLEHKIKRFMINGNWYRK